MSNPLAAFRKYQKAMLAVAAVGAMLAFGILPVISQKLDSSGGGSGAKQQNPVVASWNGGELRESDLQNHIGRRQLLVNFQQAVQMQAAERGVEPRPGIIPRNVGEGNIIETFMLAKQAEQQGIVVSDEAVIQHLQGQLAGGTMTGNELAKTLELATQKRISQSQLIEGYKLELAAHRMRVLANGGAFTGNIADNAATPAQALDYFKRLNRRMEAEVLELPVEDYVSQVQDEPSDAEVKELYEEYKNQLKSPAFPEPGFREPLRISIDWLKADFPEILDREIAKLTEEELRDYYEKNKESFTKLSLTPSASETSDIDALVADDDAEEESEGDQDEEAEDKVEYQTFEDVRTDIATTLARPKATDVVRDAITQATDEMRKFYEDYTFWQATAEEGSTPPTAPDLTEMANRLGLKSGTLPMISFLEAEDYEIGKAFDFQFSGQQPRKIMFAQKAFQPSLQKYSPQNILAPSGQDSQFVYWKTDQRDDYIPTLEEARPAIVKHWKTRKAFEIAKQAAEQIATQLKGSSQSLKTMLEDDASKEVTETGEFTWMTYGSTFSGNGAPRLSTVEGVEYAGKQFMEDVSSLESGGTTVTYNQPESKVYVVYMKAVTSSEDDLRQLFLTESNNIGVKLIAASDEFQTARDWYMGMQEKLKFEIEEREPAAN